MRHLSPAAPRLSAVFHGAVVRRSIAVALVVGTMLNLINQGDRFAAGLPPVWSKLVLTYLVPFLVASYGAWSGMAAMRRDGAVQDRPHGGDGEVADGEDRS